MADASVFDIPGEFGKWVDERLANAITAAATPENLAHFATAVSGAMQSSLESVGDRVITAISDVLGVPVASVLGDLTGVVNETTGGLSSDLREVAAALTGLATQVINGVLAELPHLLLTKENPDASA